ncbi:hypothetical protein LZ32DRAFT_146514 [Colletotrichum eremochloae]|nr:hypothetical protein LZ32DRAFT_146514 [Colletotrichum eremochloae]
MTEVLSSRIGSMVLYRGFKGSAGDDIHFDLSIHQRTASPLHDFKKSMAFHLCDFQCCNRSLNNLGNKHLSWLMPSPRYGRPPATPLSKLVRAIVEVTSGSAGCSALLGISYRIQRLRCGRVQRCCISGYNHDSHVSGELGLTVYGGLERLYSTEKERKTKVVSQGCGTQGCIKLCVGGCV